MEETLKNKARVINFLQENQKILEENSQLSTLLSKETSHPLVFHLKEHQEYLRKWHLVDFCQSAIEKLSGHPNLIKVLDHSPETLNELCKYLPVLQTVLDEKDEPLLRERIALLNIAQELQERLETKSERYGAIKERHNSSQDHWMEKVFGVVLKKNEDISCVISLLECGRKTVFASGCPKKEHDSLTNFLTLAAKKNMVILALPSDKDFERHSSMEKYFWKNGISRKHGEIEWSSRDITTVEQREKWESIKDFSASCYELKIALGEEEPPQTATVIRCERWPDGGSIPLTHVHQLLNEVDAHIDRSSQSLDETELELPRSLVHCAWGVERTSVVIAIDALRKNHQTISVEEIAEILRIGRGDEYLTPLEKLDQLRMVVEYALELGLPIFKEGEPASLADFNTIKEKAV